MYIYQQKHWPHFYWNDSDIVGVLARLRYEQGKLIGQMVDAGFSLRAEANLQTLTLEVIKSSEIEGELLDKEQVRSSIARRLGIDTLGLVPVGRDVEGVVEMILDATQNFTDPLTKNRLFGWHGAMFPIGRSGMYKITAAAWRKPETGPMQVVSGPMGREYVHFQAPDAEILDDEMQSFFDWFNQEKAIDPIIKSAIAHLWFITIHPFDDGNGRIARTIADMQLARADGSSQRFYSMSAQIRRERNDYYTILEQTQKGDLNITNWLVWFLNCLERSLGTSKDVLTNVMQKAKYWNWLTTKTINERQRLILNKLLDGFDGKLTSSKWAKIAKCSQDTALRDIQNLIDQDVLVKENPGGRSTSYLLSSITNQR